MCDVHIDSKKRLNIKNTFLDVRNKGHAATVVQNTNI